MTIQDKIAKKLLREYGEVLDTRTADGWHLKLQDQLPDEHHEPYQTCRVAFGKDHRAVLTCYVADNEDLQIAGLQRFASLADEEGMIFPYSEPHRASFHMGTVQFPIDIIFIGDDGRVTKKVENIQPGTKDTWGMPHVSAVVEANGGFCAANNIEVGTEVYELTNKVASHSYTKCMDCSKPPDFEVKWAEGRAHAWFCDSCFDTWGGEHPSELEMVRRLTDGRVEGKYGDAPGELVKKAQETFSPDPRKDINPKMLPSNPTRDRFRDRDLVDIQTKNQPMSTNHHEQIGNDPISIDPDDDSIGITRPN